MKISLQIMKGFTFNAPANTQTAAPGAPKAADTKPSGFGFNTTSTSKQTEVFAAPVYIGLN